MPLMPSVCDFKSNEAVIATMKPTISSITTSAMKQQKKSSLALTTERRQSSQNTRPVISPIPAQIKQENNYEIPQKCPKNIGRIWKWYKDANYGYILDVSDEALYIALLSKPQNCPFISEYILDENPLCLTFISADLISLLEILVLME